MLTVGYRPPDHRGMGLVVGLLYKPPAHKGRGGGEVKDMYA